jgi:hypothetical protein
MQSFKGTVTRRSNGSVEITPLNNANPPSDFEMGAEVEVSYQIIRSADEIETANAKSKPAAAAPTAAPVKAPAKVPGK